MKYTELETYKMFDDLLNDVIRPIHMLGVDFEPSRVLKRIDNLLYQAHFEDFCDALVEDGHEVEGWN